MIQFCRKDFQHVSFVVSLLVRRILQPCGLPKPILNCYLLPPPFGDTFGLLAVFVAWFPVYDMFLFFKHRCEPIFAFVFDGALFAFAYTNPAFVSLFALPPKWTPPRRTTFYFSNYLFMLPFRRHTPTAIWISDLRTHDYAF
jgi:hypothetical protein